MKAQYTPYLLLYESYGLMTQHISAQLGDHVVLLYNVNGHRTLTQHVLLPTQTVGPRCWMDIKLFFIVLKDKNYIIIRWNNIPYH